MRRTKTNAGWAFKGYRNDGREYLVAYADRDEGEWKVRLFSADYESEAELTFPTLKLAQTAIEIAHTLLPGVA